MTWHDDVSKTATQRDPPYKPGKASRRWPPHSPSLAPSAPPCFVHHNGVPDHPPAGLPPSPPASPRRLCLRPPPAALSRARLSRSASLGLCDSLRLPAYPRPPWHRSLRQKGSDRATETTSKGRARALEARPGEPDAPSEPRPPGACRLPERTPRHGRPSSTLAHCRSPRLLAPPSLPAHLASSRPPPFHGPPDLRPTARRAIARCKRRATQRHQEQRRTNASAAAEKGRTLIPSRAMAVGRARAIARALGRSTGVERKTALPFSLQRQCAAGSSARRGSSARGRRDAPGEAPRSEAEEALGARKSRPATGARCGDSALCDSAPGATRRAFEITRPTTRRRRGLERAPG